MSISFRDLVEEVKNLSLIEKEELKFLIERFVIEERRKEINKLYRESVKEFKKGKLVFSKDVNKLRETLE